MASKKGQMEGTIAVNKKAEFNYFIEERIEAGIALQGWEVKSIRAGKAQVTDCYAVIRRSEVFTVGMLISPLKTVSTHFIPEAERSRKLLLNKAEIMKLIGLAERKGYTLVITKLYWKANKVKCQVALAKGKQQHDKRDDVKQRDWQREKARIMRDK